MKTRHKHHEDIPRTREEMESLMRAVRELTIARNAAQIELEKARVALDEGYRPTLQAYEAQIERCVEKLHGWAEANREAFEGRKSLETPHGVLGWRVGQPTLRTLAGWTWERVLDAVRAAWPAYVRVKEEVNRQAILADRENLGPEALRSMGVRVAQDEPFFVEPRLDEPPAQRQESMSPAVQARA